jgi:hypothetical protein
MRSRRTTPILRAVVVFLAWYGGARAQPQDEIGDLRKQIAGLKGVVARLESQLDAIERKQAAASARATPPAQDAPAPAAAAISSLAQRETTGRDAETAARIDNVPLDPSRKGFINIPGTQSAFKIGGYAKVDAIVDPKEAGNPDEFVTSSIPVGVPPGANNSNFNVHARQTRINLDLRRQEQDDELRIFLEADFFGSDGPAAFHLRHAYGQVKNMLLGWTWSTLSDPDSFPDTLDHQMTNGVSVTRQPQIRYTAPFGKHDSLAFGIEKPSPDVSIPGVTNVARYPDEIIRYRHEDDWGHLQMGVVFRQIGGASNTANATRSVFGVGGMLTGGIKVAGRDSLTFGASYGDGMAHYISNVSGQGLDAALNSSRNDLAALPSLGAYGAYQRRWARTLRSSLTYGLNRISNSPAQDDTAFRQAYYVSGNLIWRPFQAAEMGVEYLHGRNYQRDRDNANASRIQFSVKYDLVY